MRLLLNVEVPIHVDIFEQRPSYLWGDAKRVFAQKVNLYEESEFCSLIFWLEENTTFRAVDCVVDVEDCVKLIYEGPRADA